jgi:hypothetical protein
MSENVVGIVPLFGQQPPERVILPPDPPATPHAPANPEQVHAVDAVFAQERESHLVAGLLGVWTGSLLLADLAKEHFHVPTDLDNRGKPKLPEPDDRDKE